MIKRLTIHTWPFYNVGMDKRRIVIDLTQDDLAMLEALAASLRSADRQKAGRPGELGFPVTQTLRDSWKLGAYVAEKFPGMIALALNGGHE